MMLFLPLFFSSDMSTRHLSKLPAFSVVAILSAIYARLVCTYLLLVDSLAGQVLDVQIHQTKMHSSKLMAACAL